LFAGCATSGSDGPIDDDVQETEQDVSAKSTVATNFGSVTAQRDPDATYSFILPEQNLGLTIRTTATKLGTNWALMNGVEATPFSELIINDETEEKISEAIASHARLETRIIGNIRFFFPEEYSGLLSSANGDIWSAKYSEKQFGLSFGADTPLSSLLATLGQSLKMTVVSDHTISDSLSGEISFSGVTLPDALAALLLSARIPLDSISFEHSDEYVFIHSIRNPSRPNYQIATPTPQNSQTLTERCTIDLANEIVNDSGIRTNYKKLSEVVKQLSEQFEVAIEFDPTLKDFPITPMYIHDVTRKQALELLLRQWPVPQFGYSFDGEKILLGRF
jgi:hypothetical protein